MMELLLTRKDVFQYLHWILYGDFNFTFKLKKLYIRPNSGFECELNGAKPESFIRRFETISRPF